jgi:hypothetical protein
VTESGRRQRDARSSAAVGVDVNPSKDLGAVVRDPRSLLDITVLISRSAWSLLPEHRKLNTEPSGTEKVGVKVNLVSRFEMNYVIQLIS